MPTSIHRRPRPSRFRDLILAGTGGGTSELAFTFAAPTSSNLIDVGSNYNLAVKFQASSSVSCTGVQWRVPDTAPATTCTVSLWDVGSQTRLASKTVDFTGQGGQTVKTYFATPVTLTAATDYMAAVYTPTRYVATTNDTWPKTAGVLTASASNGWLAVGLEPATAVNDFPGTQSGNSANFHVSPVVLVAS